MTSEKEMEGRVEGGKEGEVEGVGGRGKRES